MMKPNQDIRDYMADHGVTQAMLAEEVGVSQWTICQRMKKEMPSKDKEMYLNLIDSIVAERNEGADVPAEEPEEIEEVSCSTKFQIGDRVRLPSKSNKVGIVTDIWHSLANSMIMYAVENKDDGHYGMYAESQLEPAPLPTNFSWKINIDGNVAVATMIAEQGDKTWIYARGHAHIIHDGEIGLAQAVSYAARRMFEELDKKQENPVYFKRGTNNDL